MELNSIIDLISLILKSNIVKSQLVFLKNSQNLRIIAN